MIKRLKNKIKKHFEEVIRIKTSPESLAIGFALGTFLAILPTFGLGILIGLVFILIFKKVSKISMLLAFAIWNPLAQIPIYAISYTIGDFILQDFPARSFSLEIINQIYIYSRRLLVGVILMAITLSTISYFLILKIAKKYHLKKILES